MELAQFKKKYKRFQGLPVFITRFNKLFFDVILINKRFIEQHTEPEIRFFLWHEADHFRQGWIRGFNGQKGEIEAQQYAIKQMEKEGHSFNDLLCWELSYRLWSKYGLTAREYIEEMRT